MQKLHASGCGCEYVCLFACFSVALQVGLQALMKYYQIKLLCRSLPSVHRFTVHLLSGKYSLRTEFKIFTNE